MKFRVLRRAVRVDQFERSTGEAPNLGKLGRTSGRAASRKRRRKRLGRKRTAWIATRNWTLVMVVLGLVCLGAGIGTWLMPTMKMGKRPAVSGTGIALVPVEDEEESADSRFPAPTTEEAFELVKAGIAARDPEEVLEYFRPGSSSAGEIIRFLEETGKMEGAPTQYKWLGGIDANGLRLEGMTVVLSLDGKDSSRLAILTPDNGERWKIDFESFARTVKPSWSALLEGQADQGLVRVLIVPDNYYNGVFRDESAWVCYGMTSPDSGKVLMGYCKAGSPQAEAMERIVTESRRRLDFHGLCRATLEIRRPAGADASQFEITRVLAQDWVLADKRKRSTQPH
jgi:hypothetical protein